MNKCHSYEVLALISWSLKTTLFGETYRLWRSQSTSKSIVINFVDIEFEIIITEILHIPNLKIDWILAWACHTEQTIAGSRQDMEKQNPLFADLSPASYHPDPIYMERCPYIVNFIINAQFHLQERLLTPVSMFISIKEKIWKRKKNIILFC